MSKREYFNIALSLAKTNSGKRWLTKCVETPSHQMTNTRIALLKIALKR